MNFQVKYWETKIGLKEFRKKGRNKAFERLDYPHTTTSKVYPKQNK